MWANWAGNQSAATPITRPSSIDELQQAVARADSLRIAGAGHSFTPIVAGGDRIHDLSSLDLPTLGEVGNDRTWVNANARLRDLSLALADRGLAFRNLGDIMRSRWPVRSRPRRMARGATCLALRLKSPQPGLLERAEMFCPPMKSRLRWRRSRWGCWAF